jgi:hypothetical protein
MTTPIPLPGTLIGSWRGIPFHVPDISHEAGRRIVSFAFPGADFTQEEDLYRVNGRIRVHGLLVGDDYTIMEEVLSAAFEAPGPGLLVHPWRGPIMAVLIEPAQFTYQADRLRTVSFEATFIKSGGSGLTLASTLAGVREAAGGLSFAAEVLTGLAFVASVGDAALRIVAGNFGSMLLSSVSGLIFSALPGLPVLLNVAFDAVSAWSWISGWVGAIADAGTPLQSPAIGAGPSGRSATPAIPTATTVRALLDMATNATGSGADPQGLLTLSMRAACLSAVVSPLAAMQYDSRQEAMAWRSQIVAAIDSVASDAAIIARTYPSEAGALWRGLIALRRAELADIDDRIGRLPVVMSVSLPGVVSTWLIAQHVAGDSPSRVVAAYDDIVRRNRLRHPGLAGPDAVEVLP